MHARSQSAQQVMHPGLACLRPPRRAHSAPHARPRRGTVWRARSRTQTNSSCRPCGAASSWGARPIFPSAGAAWTWPGSRCAHAHRQRSKPGRQPPLPPQQQHSTRGMQRSIKGVQQHSIKGHQPARAQKQLHSRQAVQPLRSTHLSPHLLPQTRTSQPSAQHPNRPPLQIQATHHQHQSTATAHVLLLAPPPTCLLPPAMLLTPPSALVPADQSPPRHPRTATSPPAPYLTGTGRPPRSLLCLRPRKPRMKLPLRSKAWQAACCLRTQCASSVVALNTVCWTAVRRSSSSFG